MLNYTRKWCVIVSLMTLSLAASMPTSITSTTPSSISSSTAASRYQSDEDALIDNTRRSLSIMTSQAPSTYMQVLHRLPNITISEELLVTNDVSEQFQRGMKETRMQHPVEQENFIKLTLVKNETKGSRKQAVAKDSVAKRTETTTEGNAKRVTAVTNVKLSPNLKLQLKNATVAYHRGTVGGATTTGPKMSITKNIAMTSKPKVSSISNSTVTTTTIKKIKPGWPFTTVKTKNDINRYKNYTQLNRNKNANSTKNNELKQTDPTDFILYHIPSVDPMPEVTSYSPQYTFDRPQTSGSLSDPNNNIVPLSAVETSSNGYPSNPLDDPTDLGDIVDIPLGTVDLDLVPDSPNPQGQFYAADDVGGAGNPCPSYHLTSNVFAPQAKQLANGCPDLNVVLNSHYHPAYDTRKPEMAAAPVAPLADPAAAPVQAAAPAAGAVPAGGGGFPAGGFPPLGVPQLPEFPSLPNISLPDLKGLMGVVSALWSGAQAIFRYIWPVLVAIPTIVFIKTLVTTFIAMFPWWFPALFYVAAKSDDKEKTHYHYKHVHKPVVHPNGWFWNSQTKTWTNILDKKLAHHHGHRAGPHVHIQHKRSIDILKDIEEFKAKFR